MDGNEIFVLYKMGTDAHTPTILGVFHEVKETLEVLDEFLSTYYDDVFGKDGCSEISKEEYVENVCDGISNARTFHDEILEETYYLELTTMGGIK